MAALFVLWFAIGTSVSAAQPASSGTGSAGAPLQITRITPSGEDTPAVKQIVFEFNRPVAPLGRMERDESEVPISFKPAVKCGWRWLNPSALSCRIDEKDALAPATRYRIVVRPGIMTEDKVTLAKEVVHTFMTERPKISEVRFSRWLSPVMPQISVWFSQPVDEKSIAEHVFFKGEKAGRVSARIQIHPQYSKDDSIYKARVWLATPVSELPPGKAVDVLVEPGVRSLKGPEPGVENRKVFGFETFGPFGFVGVKCKDLAGRDAVFRSDEPQKAGVRCNPDEDISMLFTSPVDKDELKKGIKTVPALVKKPEVSDPWEDVYTHSSLSSSRKKRQTYDVSFPSGGLKPYTEYRLQAGQGTFRDEFGRRLSGPIDLRFATDHRPAVFYLYKGMPVLEKGLETEAPLFVTNLTRVDLTYEALTADGKVERQSKALPVSKPKDVTSALQLGVRKLLSKGSGVVMGRFTTQPVVSEKEASDKWFFAQVTPFSVHAKIGHHNTLVWLTDLQSGRPVSGVRVEIYKDTLKNLPAKPSILSQAETGREGVAELAGLATLDPDLELIHAYERNTPRLFVRCVKGDDIAVLPIEYTFRVDSEGAENEYIPARHRPRHGLIRSWGATAQGVYRLGDTVQFKIYVRDQDNRRFTAPPLSGYSLKVIDPTDKVVHERGDVKLSEFGAFDGEFPVPKNGAVGWYRFVLSTPRQADESEEVEPLRVLVADFTPSPFKVSVDLNGEIFGIEDTVKSITQAKLHAGGPFASAEVRINALLEPAAFVPADPRLKGFAFTVFGDDRPGTESLRETKEKLDDKGVFEEEFPVPETSVLYGRMTVESSVKDERGKSVAGRASATFYGRDRYVGLAGTDWLLEEGKPGKMRVVVVDQLGKPVAGADINLKIERKQVSAARVKDAGDAYVPQYEEEWIETETMRLVSSEEPLAFEFTPKQSGQHRIVAGISDTKQRPHETVVKRWVTGKGYVLWETTPGNQMNVYPEKSEYRVGETAKFLVQNPFPGATALITVERFGVVQSWVKALPSSAEIVEVPVLPDYLPGFFLSVLVVSPRVDKPLSPEGEDLGKPAFRMGYARIEVKDTYKQINVTARPDREVYKPRETVTVELEAHAANLGPNESPPPVELAVAVLDEAVFDLIRTGKEAFDPYKGFYKMDDLDLSNFNLIMQLIGREKLEEKGASPGGDGGFDLGMRSLFKFVSYWNPSIRVDKEGKAKISFQVPDNLTGWRVLAMAVTPDDRMGLGDIVFRVNQSTEIRPVLPNQVMEGDSFDVGFSVMNRTETARTLDVSINAEGPVTGAGGEPKPTLSTKITAEPFKRQTIRLPVKASGPGPIVLTARAGDEKDRDGLKHTLTVLKRSSPEVAAVYGTSVQGEVTQSVVFPQMTPGSGKLGVSLIPTAIGGVEGAFKYMREYPYSCWEQKITIGVMAALYQELKPYITDKFTWEESEDLPKKMLELAVEYQAPNGGMTYYVPKDEYADPFLSAYTAFAFNRLRENGHTVPRQVETKLSEYLQKFLQRKDLPEYYTAGMTSTVRSLALASLAESGKIGKEELDRYWGRVGEMSLFGKAHYLRALTRVPGTYQRQSELIKTILSYGDRTGGGITFNESLDSGYRVLLCSGVRDNSAVLSALLAFKAANPADTSLGDIPVDLMRSIVMGRKTRSFWASTQENVFAVLALAEYSRVYEGTPPNMSVTALLDTTELGRAQLRSLKDLPAPVEYAVQPADIGRSATLRLKKEGEGRYYYTAGITYTPAQDKAGTVNAGIEVHREYSVERNGEWVLLQSPMEVKSGELVRVDLYVILPAERYFVVVEDPVPGGFEPVNRDLATTSIVDAAKGEVAYPAGSFRLQSRDWLTFTLSRMSFYHRELKHDSVRFYSERLKPGRYHLSYAAQAIAPGEFSALPTRAEEMYSPDVFGKGAPAALRVLKTD